MFGTNILHIDFFLYNRNTFNTVIMYCVRNWFFYYHDWELLDNIWIVLKVNSVTVFVLLHLYIVCAKTNIVLLTRWW